MFKIQEIRELIKLIDQSSIDKFTFEADGAKIKLEKREGHTTTTETITSAPPVIQQASTVAPQQEVAQVPTPAPKHEQPKEEKEPAATAADDSSLHRITSPMVGTFYAASSPEEAAYVQKGDKVKPEAIVCIVEAMKLFNEIEAEVSGEIVEILVKDGELVEYGQPLFLVKAD